MLPAPTKAMRLWSNAEVLKERVALEKKYDEAIAEVKSKFKSKEIDSLLDDFVISRYDGGFDKLQQIVGKYQHSKLDVLARRLNRLANEKKALDYLNERVAHMKPRGVAIYQDNVMETAASLGGFVMKLPKDFFAKIERNRQIRNSINRAFADLHQSYIDGQIAKNSVVANAVKNLEAKYTPLSLKEREVQAKQRIAERNERIKEVDRLIEKEASGRADESSLDNWSNERRKAIAERDKAEGELQKIEHEKRSEAGIKSAITRAKNERRKLEEEIYRRELKHGKRIAKENAKRIAEAEEEERRRPAREARRKAMKDAMRKADIDEKRRAEEEARRKADEETESPSTQEETDTTQKEGVKDTPDISTEELEANPAFMRNNKIRQGNLKRFYPNRMEEYINPSSCEVIVLAGEKTDGTKVYHKLNSNGITINEVITEVPNGFGKHAIDNPNGGKVLRTVATTQDTASSAPESAKNFYTKKDNLPTIDFFDMSTKQVNYVQAYYSNDPELYLDKNNNAVSGGKNHKFSVIAPDGQEMEKGTASLSKYLPVKRVYRAVLTDVDGEVVGRRNEQSPLETSSVEDINKKFGKDVADVFSEFAVTVKEAERNITTTKKAGEQADFVMDEVKRNADVVSALNKYGKAMAKVNGSVPYSVSPAIVDTLTSVFGSDKDAAEAIKHAIDNGGFNAKVFNSRNEAKDAKPTAKPVAKKAEKSVAKVKKEADKPVNDKAEVKTDKNQEPKDKKAKRSIQEINKEIKALEKKLDEVTKAARMALDEKFALENKGATEEEIDAIGDKVFDLMQEKKKLEAELKPLYWERVEIGVPMPEDFDNAIKYMTGYHGSAANFDRLDHSFMGSGEGAQAFGWGSYLSEVNGIAKGYADRSYQDKFMTYVMEKIPNLHELFGYDDYGDLDFVSLDMLETFIESIKEDIANEERFLSFSYEQFVDYQNNNNLLIDILSEEQINETKSLEAYQDFIKLHKRYHESQKKALLEYGNALRVYKEVSSTLSHNLYTIEHPDDTGDNYLHREKPVQQSLVEKLKANAKTRDLNFSGMTGGQLYHKLTALLGSDKNASLFLSSLGIIGNSVPTNYTRHGSRDKTRNYVIFKEEDAKIIDHIKYMAGLSNENKYANAQAATDFALNGNPVITITGKEFEKPEDGSHDLDERVAKYYHDKYSGAVDSPYLGRVILDKNGVNDSIAHGVGRMKAAAFTAVPEVIKGGLILRTDENWKGRGYDTAVIVAPIKVGDEKYVCEVVVKRLKDKNTFYLHEVNLQEDVASTIKSSTGEASTRNVARPTRSIIAKTLEEFKEKDNSIKHMAGGNPMGGNGMNDTINDSPLHHQGVKDMRHALGFPNEEIEKLGDFSVLGITSRILTRADNTLEGALELARKKIAEKEAGKVQAWHPDDHRVVQLQHQLLAEDIVAEEERLAELRVKGGSIEDIRDSAIALQEKTADLAILQRAANLSGSAWAHEGNARKYTMTMDLSHELQSIAVVIKGPALYVADFLAPFSSPLLSHSTSCMFHPF